MTTHPSTPASLDFPVRTAADAPEASRAAVEAVQKAFGFVPNLIGTLANVPAGLQAYLSASDAFDKTSFTPLEQQLILLAVSQVNGCDYCLAAHSTFARRAYSADAATLAAVRQGSRLPDAKQDALVSLTREIVTQRGHVSAETLAAFIAAGYTREQVVEILLGVVLKTISNFIVHLSPIEIDPAFQSEAQAAA